MRNLYVRLLAKSFNKGRDRQDFIEQCQSDAYYAGEANTRVSRIYSGALVQSARSFLISPGKLFFGYLLLSTGFIAVSAGFSSITLDSYVVMWFVLVANSTWSMYLQAKLRPRIGNWLYVATSAWCLLAIVLGQEFSSFCVDCSISILSERDQLLNNFLTVFLLVSLASFILTHIKIVGSALQDKFFGVAIGIFLTWLAEMLILSQVLSNSDRFGTLFDWLRMSQPVPIEVAGFIYILLASWFLMCPIVLAVLYFRMSRAVPPFH